MNRKKWMLGEIDQWEIRELIPHETAELLRGEYSGKQSAGTLMLLFSLIGSALIGGGIILISAKNWYDLPIWGRLAISFAPLLAAQLLCGYVVLKKYLSAPWREGTALFLTASVFAVIALVGQIFHIPGDYGNYILVCGLLSLPAIYILKAASPSAIYLWTVLNWAGLTSVSIGEYTRFWMIPLLALLVPFCILSIQKHFADAKGQFLLCVLSVGGLIGVWILFAPLAQDTVNTILGAILLYSAMLYSMGHYIEGSDFHGSHPLKIVGGIGGTIILFILSYSGAWDVIRNNDSALPLVSYTPYLISALVLLGGSLLALARAKQSRTERAITAVCIITALGTVAAGYCSMDGMLPSAAVNLFLLLIGTEMIVKGVRELRTGFANLGMLLVCLLIILRFFDWQLEFLTKGIAFVALGICFLSANLYLSKRKAATRL